MNKNYSKQLLANIKDLTTEGGEPYIDILTVVTELMRQVQGGQLKGATYTNEFRCDRIKITVSIGQYYEKI